MSPSFSSPQMFRTRSKGILVWASHVDLPGRTFHPTGQGIITSFLVKSLSRHFIIAPISLVNFIPSIFYLYYCTFVVFSFNRIYLVSSRTPFGFMRDLPPLLLSLFGIPVVVHIHGSDLPNLFRYPIIGLLAKFLYSHVFRIICPNQLAADEIQALLKNVSVFKCDNFAPYFPPLGSDCLPPSISFLESILSVDTPPPLRFIWNSNIMASKGIIEVLEAFNILINQIDRPVELLVLGSMMADHEMTLHQLKQQILPFRRIKCIKFVGSIDSDLASHFLSVSDICILNSRYPTECQPLSLLSAMSMGKVVICSRNKYIVSTIGSYPAVFIDNSFSAMSVFDSLLHATLSYDSLCNSSCSHSRYNSVRYSSNTFLENMTELVFS